jgi:hypothetical protein
MSCAQLTADAHSVVMMRVLGMSGVWSVPHGESHAMVTEKVPAFTQAMVAGTISALSGHQPEQVGHAAIAPLSSAARDNRRRLASRGPRVPGLVLPHDDPEGSKTC